MFDFTENINCNEISDLVDMRAGNKNTISDDKQETRAKHEENVESETFSVTLDKVNEDNSIAKSILTSKFSNKQEFEHITRSNHNRTVGNQVNSEQPTTEETFQMTDQEPKLDRPIEGEHHQNDRDHREQEGRISVRSIPLLLFYFSSEINLGLINKN